MRGLLVVAILAGAALAIESAGCEALVTSALPSFTCVPGHPDTCPSGQVCSLAGVCIAACPRTPCPADATCDAQTHLCVSTIEASDASGVASSDATTPVDASDAIDAGDDASPRGGVGSLCQTQLSCNAGLICADTSALTAEIVRNTGSVCTKTCCRSEDCPADFACYSPGTGGNYCVRASELLRLSTTGTKVGGSPCASSRECRSGICADANARGVMRCADACCTDSDCTGGGVCGQATIEGHLTMACTEPLGTGTVGEPCTLEACKNGLCGAPEGSPMKRCLARCCGKHSCGTANTACTYVTLQGAKVPEYIPACFSTAGSRGSVGDACTDTTHGSDCESGFCEPYTKKCTDVCCTDSDCESYPGYTACRPDTNPSVHYLVCSPPPPT